VAVTGVTLDKTEVALNIGETVTLTATVAPDDATDKTVTWATRAHRGTDPL
ncbi:MAG: Ig-like domain-containing protein, partial [Bacteroidales bacterium]|nr:Ig-like domain-containing protein [Bacteroidales bacterium]